MYRDIYGLHAPLRLMMERKVVSTVSTLYYLLFGTVITSEQSIHTSVLPRSNVHLDVLMGRDESLDAVDIFDGSSVALSMAFC